MPRKWTFQCPKMRAWVEARLTGNILNLFGGVVRLTAPQGATITHNDINKELLTANDLNLDAYDLAAWRNHAGYFDTVVFDPPYSAHQAVVSYAAKKQQKVNHARDVVEYVLKPQGRVISLGWNTTGMSAGRGFNKSELLVVNHGGSHNDTLILAEQRTGDEPI